METENQPVRHSRWSEQLLAVARNVQLLCLDVDGVLTDGAMYYGADGEVLKRFDTRDASGLANIRGIGIEVAWITAEKSLITQARAHKLGIELLIEGRHDKLEAARELAGELDRSLLDMAYMGDDWFDVPLLEMVRFSACPADAHDLVKQSVQLVTSKNGGNGAVREVCDLLVEARQGSKMNWTGQA